MSGCYEEYSRTVKSAVFRRKEVGNKKSALETKLKRCLKVSDVIFLGIAHTVGTGLYVVTADIARNIAGPAAIISFVIAGFVSINIALCYAEFSSRIPWAGSAYAYAYITIGEIWAFLVGWNVLLENLIGLGTAGMTWGNYLDHAIGSKVSDYLKTAIGQIDNPILASTPNVLGIGLVVILMLLLTCGVKGSIATNNIFTVINLSTIVIIVVFGSWHAEVKNWTLPEYGGFMPFGIGGVVKGAGIALFGYIGFEVMASTAEEMKDPCRNMPKSMIITVTIVTLCYLSVTTVLTLDLPYRQLVANVGITDLFNKLHYPGLKWIVTVGALVAMTGSGMGSLYACSRSAYAMAIDGMFPKCFGDVTKENLVPVFGIVFFGVLGIILAGFFKLSFLVELLSIGCLFAFSIVSACLIILRYTPTYKITLPEMYETDDSNRGVSQTTLEDPRQEAFEDDTDASSVKELQDVLEGTGRLKLRFIRLNQMWPFNLEPGVLVAANVLNMSLAIFFIAIIMKLTPWTENHWIQAGLALTGVFFGSNFIIICMHQQNPEKHYFKIPLVPFIPTFSLCLNVTLMVSLQWETWVRFVAWIILGLALYFGYGVRRTSSQRQLMPRTETSVLISTSDNSIMTVRSSR